MTTVRKDPKEHFERLNSLEKWWLRIGISMLIVFVTFVVFDAIAKGSNNSHGMQTIAPEKVYSTPPFDKPGVRKGKNGTYEAIVVAYAFGFQPAKEMVVPSDTPIRFRVASVDVVHGFQIPGKTNVNLEVVPGHVSEVTQTFHKPGRYLILCHEYCGSQHHFMISHITVVKKGEPLELIDAPADAGHSDDAAHAAEEAAHTDGAHA